MTDDDRLTPGAVVEPPTSAFCPVAYPEATSMEVHDGTLLLSDTDERAVVVYAPGQWRCVYRSDVSQKSVQ